MAEEGIPIDPKNGASRTVDDEEKILQELYGSPDEDGIYRGESV